MLPVAAGVRTARPPGLTRHDLSRSRLPRYARAVLEALRFDGTRPGVLGGLSDEEFAKALTFCDKSQLTLILDHACRGDLPPWVQARIRRNVRDYSVRFNRLKQSLFEIADVVESRGIDYVVLKGLSHSPEFTPDPLLRAQCDIDVWCSPETVGAARDALMELGYQPAGPGHARHLPPLIRETHWDWKGDYFASDLPIPVELHHHLWDANLESIPLAGEWRFWDRRTVASYDGRRLPILSKPDALAFASLHVLMHLLHGDLRLQRAWEIARFLHAHAQDAGFWCSWRRWHDDPLRRLQAIVFMLASDWFAADLADEAAEEIDRLPGEIKLWLDTYALSPLEAPFRPNKDELWLHLALVESARDRRSIFLRRVLPLRPPPRVDESTIHRRRATPAMWKRRVLFLAARARYHCRSVLPVLMEGLRWRWATRAPGRGFLWFQAASVLLSLGMFIFLMLYNLYLLELGFRADLIGRVAGALSMGTFLGAACAARVTRRTGLRNSILVAILGSATLMALRGFAATEGWLLATALAHGAFLSWWIVSFSPAVAGLTDERKRPFAFSLACSAGVCVGILAGLAGGKLPGIVRSMFPDAGSVETSRVALWAAAGIAALAAWPASRLRFAKEARAEEKVYPRGRFVVAFLVCLSLWSVAVGAFNPFFNAYLAERMKMGVERIGFAFALSQAGQALALLSAPLLLRRLGQVRGVAYMQFATGLALLSLAFSSGAGVATASYIAYTSFQYMSEPGVFSMLMSRVTPGERSGASALYFLVTSVGGSLAALAAGSAILRFGYPWVLGAAALVASAAALLFRSLIADAPTMRPCPSQPSESLPAGFPDRGGKTRSARTAGQSGAADGGSAGSVHEPAIDRSVQA